MDIIYVIILCLISIFIGAVLMFLLQYYVLFKHFQFAEKTTQNSYEDKTYKLPENVLMCIKCNEIEDLTIIGVNLVVQFLFHELKTSNTVRKWFYRKLSLELDELIAKTTVGKLFEKLTICELDLGTQFPEIKNIKVHDVNILEPEECIETFDIIFELEYHGNFKLSIDADMVLGKKGSLTVKVSKLMGMARLRFTRKPFTHWSICFINDPHLVLSIEGQFQGRKMQSNLIGLISNQIRKTICRKHTLPKYKIRLKPFFQIINDEIDFDIIPNGKLNIKILQLTRLLVPDNITKIYCTLTLSPIPWVKSEIYNNKNLLLKIEISIHKAKNQQIGIVFKLKNGFIVIEDILPNTPATKANLKAGDILLTIEGIRVTTITQIAKIIKNHDKPIIIIRIQRIIPGVIKNNNVEQLKPEKNLLKHTNIAHNDLSLNLKNIASCGDDGEDLNSVPVFYQYITVDSEYSNFIQLKDSCWFKLNAQSTNINLCVYAKNETENQLLGYANLSINSILGECSETTLEESIRFYPLKPSEDINVMINHSLSSHSGFNALRCFGDILLSFSWSEGELNLKDGDYIQKQKSSKSSRSNTTKSHNFVRTHFKNSTLCCYCGKKIWLKDAVQCHDCRMCCHKKCVTKCEASTVCSPCNTNPSNKMSYLVDQPEFKLIEESYDDGIDVQDENKKKYGIKLHRQSITNLLAHGLKRVSSANNLAVPGTSTANAGSLSLPPSPQHTPRKLSLANESTNHFMDIRQLLESFPANAEEVGEEHIIKLTGPLIGCDKVKDIMSYAKTASKFLYIELEPYKRVEQINMLLAKLRIALDTETSYHASLLTCKQNNEGRTGNLLDTTLETDLEKKVNLAKESEERIHALSVMMLYLCTGLQHAQGLAEIP